jgi:hypothetical protein
MATAGRGRKDYLKGCSGIAALHPLIEHSDDMDVGEKAFMRNGD